MDAAAVEQVIALGRDPVPGANPAGEPVRYDPLFESLQRQMDRMGSLSGEVVDWAAVVQLSTDILKNKSKDMLVMTYLALALLERNGYAGLCAALQAYTELLNKFAETCFPKPKPPHGRKNAVQYLLDKVLEQIETKDGRRKREPAANEKEAVHKAADASAPFDEAVTKAFTGMPETPNVIPLTRALKTLREKVGPLVSAAPAGEAAPAAGGASSSAAPSAATSAPSGGGGGGASVPENFTTATQAVQAVVKVAKYLLSQDNKDARGYRLMRAVNFGGLGELPKDKVIPGPPPPRRQFFEKLASDGNWPQLLTEAEGQFAATPLWLDMQRYVALALKGLGPAYRAAADSVVFDTVALQQRMPDLFDLCFKDGTGFADGATKAWIAELAGTFGGGGGGGGGAGAGDAVDHAVADARKMLSESKPAEAIERLAAASASCSGRRARFRAQLALADLCVDLNKLALAASILEGLEATITDYRLDEWDPELAAETYRLLHDCWIRSRPKPTAEEVVRINGLFARLCRLAPTEAYRIDAAASKAKAPAPA